jgi:hypothetical protein
VVVGEITKPVPLTPLEKESAPAGPEASARDIDYLQPVVPGSPAYDALVALQKAALEKRSFKPYEGGPPPLTKEERQRETARECEKYALERKKREQAIVNACKARRESYCNRGIEAIQNANTLNGTRYGASTDAARENAVARGESLPPVRMGYVSPGPADPVAPAGCGGNIRKR